MLTILYPELLPAIRNFPAGLMALFPENSERPILIVKVLKEAILAARMRKGFSIYLAPVNVAGVDSAALITAFFDIPDEPLVIRTPLFADDPHSKSLLDLLQLPEIDVHFFDEHAREMLAYSSIIAIPTTTRRRIEHAQLGAYAHDVWRGVDDQMQSWFSRRSEADDREAVNMQFVVAIMPEDIALIDTTTEGNSYAGATPVTSAFLVRREPGAMQEHDIALLLQRIFGPDQIVRGPLRISDREEIADILVVTDKNIIFFQAKDSPNTEEVLANPIFRKRATALKGLKKAVGQLRGAIRYARMGDPMPFIVGGEELALDVARLKWRAIAVVKELFNDEFTTYSPLILQLAKETGVSTIALDYADLNMYTANLGTEEAFVAAIDQVFSVGQGRGELPRLRIGPVEAL